MGYRDFIWAARIIDEANARLGNGDNASWTAADMRQLASSVASEEHATAPCPVCRNTVQATTTARITSHRDSSGRMCPAAGLAWHTAVVS